MNSVIELVLTAMGQVWLTLQHNWPFLLVSILIAAAMKLYLDTNSVARFLRRHERGGVAVATTAAVATPLCSCGTTAIVLGMMAGSMPWAPIVAFMVASPLTSPEELIYSAGLFGWPFALAFFGASIVLGLMGGAAAQVLDARGWLKNQARFATDEKVQVSSAPAASPAETGMWELPAAASRKDMAAAFGSYGREGAPAGGCDCDTAVLPRPIFLVASEPCGCSGDVAGVIELAPASTCGCDEQASTRIELMPATSCGCSGGDAPGVIELAPASACGCGGQANTAVAPVRAASCGCGAPDAPGATTPARRKFDLGEFAREAFVTGRRLLVLFVGFAFVGYLINDLIPAAWITALFGAGHSYSVPLAATLGLPFYINSEASLPLVAAMLNSGMSSGAALAFLITGAGTSMGAIAGALTIARWRVIGLVIATLWVGAILCGFGYDALLAAGLF